MSWAVLEVGFTRVMIGGVNLSDDRWGLPE